MVNCKEKIKKLMKVNGKMYPSDIAEKVGCSYSDVLKGLNSLEKGGFVVKG